MENNQNRNYDRDEHNYKIKNNQLSEDQPNQIKPNEHKRDGEQFEEFSTDQPNRQDDDRKINTPPGTEDEKWKTDQNLEDDFYQNRDEEDQKNPLRQDRNI
jgi:hypothetical protein